MRNLERESKPDDLNQNIHFDKTRRWVILTLKFENHGSKISKICYGEEMLSRITENCIRTVWSQYIYDNQAKARNSRGKDKGPIRRYNQAAKPEIQF